MRSPFFPKLHKLFRCRELSPAKSFGETFANTVIIDWPDVRPSEIEQEKHLNRPAAYAAHLCEARDNFVIAHPEKCAAGWHGPVDCFCSEILQCGSFRTRKASGTKCFVRGREQLFGIEPFSFGIESANTAKNCGCSFAAQLLVSNRFGQRVEWVDRNRGGDVVSARAGDQLRHAPISVGKMSMRFFVIHNPA